MNGTEEFVRTGVVRSRFRISIHKNMFLELQLVQFEVLYGTIIPYSNCHM